MQDVFEYLKQGHRLKAPEGAPKEVYHGIMCRCWNYQPKDRPTFRAIVTQLDVILAELQRR